MIRFRSSEDERRYLLLHGEMCRRITSAGLSDATACQILRNLGKIEMMLFLEGIRQGLAAGALGHEAVKANEGAQEVAAPSPMPDPFAFKAYQLHAMVYGSADTPLRAVEKEWLDRLGLPENHLATSWLDDKPMRFAPMTVAEAMGEPTAPPPVVKIHADRAPVPLALPADDASGGWDRTNADGLDDQPFEVDRERPESPIFLDQVRDRLQVMTASGWKPVTWPELILRLHQEMSVDAAFLDLQLSTDFGRTVLDQCGLAGIAPGASIVFNDLLTIPGQAPSE